MKKIIVFWVILLMALATAFPTFAFSDVSVDHGSYQAISYLRDKGVVDGYEDGYFRPELKINRAEFLKIVMESADIETARTEVTDGLGDSGRCFTDVPVDVWFAPYVCGAKKNGVVSGYPDGSFKPGQNVNLAEALKITIEAHQVGYSAAGEGEPWYLPYLNVMGDNGYIPESFTYLEQNVKRGEMAEMVWRLMQKIGDRPFAAVDDLKTGCQPLGEDLQNIDMDRVRATWLEWYNKARADAGLHPYRYNNQLNRTATDWSNFSAARGYIDHKRPGTTAYYDYNAITDWYRDRGLEFQNLNRVTHSENIGWNVYSCDKEDCTDEVIRQLRPTFDFYMAEKNKAYRAHYDSVMNHYFQEIGLGLATNKSPGKIFITVHYGTKILSNPTPVCVQ